MEKQYGAEKTDAIIEDAWRRYAEIVDENADEPKKMYMHTRKRIYPAIAAFDAMTGNGISREEAAAFLNRYYEKRAAGVGSKIRGAMKIPGLYKLVPRFFAKMTKSSFGEDCGFRANWIRTEQEEMCFDMLACPYQDTCVKYGCPEIVAGFCRADDEAYGHMHPKLKWGRTKTLGQGGVPFPVSWTVKMKKKQKETQDILSYHSQAAGCSDKARAKASGGRQPIEECGRTGL